MSLPDMTEDELAALQRQEPREKNCVDERRIGMFEISQERIEEYGAYLRFVMSKMVIIRAEMMYWKHAVEYVAYSELFRPVDFGAVPPRYELVVSFLDSEPIKIEAIEEGKR